MRIIAGSSKGRELFSPSSEGVRPTSDRAREGLFSTLESEFSSSKTSTYQLYRQSAEQFLGQISGLKYDIIFMDPPYPLTNADVERLLDVIVERDLLQPHGLVAVEREAKGRAFTWPQAPRAMELVKQRSYGQGSIFYGGYSATVLA